MECNLRVGEEGLGEAVQMEKVPSPWERRAGSRSRQDGQGQVGKVTLPARLKQERPGLP